MNTPTLKEFISTFWDNQVLPTLCDYIRIPAISPSYDPDWANNGHLDSAVALLERWVKTNLTNLPGATLEVLKLPGRTPLIFIDVPGTANGTTLIYGHLDKQPESTGWTEGFGPWTPVVKNGKLYGRGAVDDGYAIFSAITSLLALKDQNLPHARCLILIEGSEESGSTDIPFYVEHLKERIGAIDLMICLDSGCCTYNHLWLTTSLRGIVSGTLNINVLNCGIHSGLASGIVPSSFRILRTLLSRLEDESTGRILLQQACAEIPSDKLKQLKSTSAILGDSIADFPFAGGTKPMAETPDEIILNQAWRAQLAVTGFDGYPAPENAGNVLLPSTSAHLSMRTPPECNAEALAETVKKVLENDPPYNAVVSFDNAEGQSGWNAPPFAGWLETTLNSASTEHFGNAPAFLHQGASIPFIGFLAKKFPNTQFVVTGVSGPDSNPHGPDECLDIPSAKKLTACVAEILSAQASKRS